MLTRQECAGRAFAIIGFVVPLFLLRTFNPETPKWLPFRTSCGALTGVPCIFCGMTRALHLLLNGQFSRALYFNWLAFPFLAAIGLLIALLLTEIVRRRRILNLNAVAATRQRLTMIGLSLVVLWMLQVFLAVSERKHELLNSGGLLYRLFVKS